MKEDVKNRIEWIDTAKGLGLIFVILGHLHTPYISTWVYLFHMPLFFFLSGVTFSGEKYTFKQFIVKRLKTLVIPYFTLGIFIWLFYVIVNTVISPDVVEYGTNIEMLFSLLIQEHFWTIWFLAALFITEIVYYIIDLVSKKRAWLSTLLSVVLCIIGLARYRFGLGGLPWNIDVALVAQFFFHTGLLFKKYKNVHNIIFCTQKIKFFLTVTGLFVINVVAGVLCMKLSGESLDMSIGMYGNELLTMISAFAGILLIVALSNKIHNKFINYIGRNTMIIFAWHSRIVIVLFQYIFAGVGIFQNDSMAERFLYTAVMFVLILLILVPVTELIKKTKIHALFGV